MSFKKISVIGLGYIGLPTAAILASRKKKVLGIDVNQKVVDTINCGEVHIVEPELDMMVHAAVTQGYLRAATVPEPADAFLIAVPTPFKSGHEPDLSYIEAACKSIAPVLQKGNLVILESTSPVGATEQMAAWLSEIRSDLTFPQTHGEESDIRIAHCPERVLPGHVVRELVENTRVIGGMTSKCSKTAASLYKIFVDAECSITTTRTAELAKLTENSFRDVNIAFANELSMICDKLDVNVWELILLANRHPRVNILRPGPGVGGHCIAVDPWFIISAYPERAKLIATARHVNDNKPGFIAKKIYSAAKRLQNPVIACLGLTFKADIDDLRESPALAIVRKIINMDCGNILAVEPFITKLPNTLSGSHITLTSLDTALQQADIIVLLVDHKQFKAIDHDLLQQKIIIDTRGILH